MNFYKLTSNLKDGISVLNHSSNKINLKVPLSSYHDEAQKFLEHLKSSATPHKVHKLEIKHD